MYQEVFITGDGEGHNYLVPIELKDKIDKPEAIMYDYDGIISSDKQKQEATNEFINLLEGYELKGEYPRLFIIKPDLHEQIEKIGYNYNKLTFESLKEVIEHLYSKTDK